MVRAYTAWNLISSISVIYGIFFGVSLIDVPAVVKMICVKKRRHISRKPTKRRKSQLFIHQSLDTIKDEGRELNRKLQKAEKDISQNKYQMLQSLVRLEYEMLVKELQNAKKDISNTKKSIDTILRKARARNSDLPI